MEAIVVSLMMMDVVEVVGEVREIEIGAGLLLGFVVKSWLQLNPCKRTIK